MSETTPSHKRQNDPKEKTNPTDIVDGETLQPKRKQKSQAGASTNGASGAVPSSKNGLGTFEEGDDFIALPTPDTDEEVGEHDTPIQEWEQGKRAHEENHGLKRKYGDMERGNGHGGGKRQRRDHVSRKAPWVVDVDWQSCNNVPELLHREVEAFVNYISPTSEEDEVRGFIVALISKAVSKTFPDAKVMPFGSFETKLYLPTSDIDLVIDSDSMAYSDKIVVLRALANTMKRSGITDNVSIIAKAKVPIIKFITTYGRFPVDISINQVNGVAAGKMINRFIQEFPALRALVLIIKAFLSQRGMNEVFSGGLGSYSIVCLAVSFLQMHPKIRRGEIDPSKNLGVLVMEFFELYGCYFNYHEVGISIREGGFYFNKAQREWLDRSKSHLLSIEDPGDPSNDVSRGTYGIAKVRTTFAGAHGILTSTAFLHSKLISSRRHGRYTNLRKQAEPEDMSILSSVLGVTQETINHRRLVREVYYKGVLHQMLGAPKPADPSHINRGTSSKQEGEDSVASAWERADMEYSSGEDDIDSHRKRYEEQDDEEEESRYTRQPRKKRRRIDMEADYHTVYTTDEDEEDGYVRDLYTADTRGYDLVGLDGEPLSRDKRRGGRNRAYWLVKGGS